MLNTLCVIIIMWFVKLILKNSAPQTHISLLITSRKEGQEQHARATPRKSLCVVPAYSFTGWAQGKF